MLWYMIGNFLLMFKFAGFNFTSCRCCFFSLDFFMFSDFWPHNPKNVGKWLLDEIAILKKLSILVLIWFLFFAQTAWCCMKLNSSLVICAHGLEVPTKTSLNSHLPPFCFPLPFLFVNFRPALMCETTWFVFSYNQQQHDQLQNCSIGNTQYEDSTCTRWCLPSSVQASTPQRSLPRPRRLPGRSPGEANMVSWANIHSQPSSWCVSLKRSSKCGSQLWVTNGNLPCYQSNFSMLRMSWKEILREAKYLLHGRLGDLTTKQVGLQL